MTTKQQPLLLNKTILITRPDGREKYLKQLIEQASGDVLHYPVFSIQPPAESEIQQLKALQKKLHNFTMAIFISPTAVEQSHIYFPVLPEHFIIVTIGAKTSRTLEQYNVSVDLQAPEFNTESLLATTDFQMPGIKAHNILIFRGTGGRPLLGDTLVQRGAQVRYVETYCRKLPTQPCLSSQQINRLNAITISSNEGLDNLIRLIEDPDLLTDIPLFVPSQRAAVSAEKYGFKTIIKAKNATDEEMYLSLTRFFNSEK